MAKSICIIILPDIPDTILFIYFFWFFFCGCSESLLFVYFWKCNILSLRLRSIIRIKIKKRQCSIILMLVRWKCHGVRESGTLIWVAYFKTGSNGKPRALCKNKGIFALETHVKDLEYLYGNVEIQTPLLCKTSNQLWCAGRKWLQTRPTSKLFSSPQSHHFLPWHRLFSLYLLFLIAWPGWTSQKLTIPKRRCHKSLVGISRLRAMVFGLCVPHTCMKLS